MLAEYKKIVLYAALAIVGFFLWQAWIKDTQQTQQKMAQTAAATQTAVPPALTAASAATDNAQKPPVTAPAEGQIVTVRTDVLEANINTVGGNIVGSKLLKYDVSVDNKSPVTMLNDQPEQWYVAQSGLIGAQGPDSAHAQVHYQVEKQEYQLTPGQDKLSIDLSWRNPQGLKVTKTYTFYRGKYTIDVAYHIDNGSSTAWSGQMFTQLQRKDIPEQAGGIFHFHTFTGASYYTPETHYTKLSYEEMAKEPLDSQATGGWVATQQHYFLSAWIPDQQTNNHFYSATSPDNIYTIGALSPKLTVTPGDSQTVQATLYSGPEITANLEPLAKGLDLTIDYGWLWFLSSALFWVMAHINRFVGNWGWTIVITTILIKLIFYKLSETSYRSMAKMRNLQPQIENLRQRFGEDRQKLGQATMELYRKEKVNPLSGCLPMIIQIPVFIALYYVLIESVQLRQAPFIFWIQDLSIRDPYYILPVLMGVSMFVQQKLNPPPPDPTQAKVMMFLPLIFTVFFLSFPAGLVLYWLVNNVVSALQQWLIMYRFTKHQARSKK